MQINCEQNYILEPIYDNEDNVCGMYYNSEPFYFIKNLQGDIIAISNYWGEIVARYTYDAWGKITNISGSRMDIANANPFRYRSYFYDTETELYYLQSRYYDANVGRFINADDIRLVSMSSKQTGNLFLYCANNPVNDFDEHGYIGWGTIVQVISYLMDFFVSVTQTVESGSKKVTDVIAAIKRGKSVGASKEWIRLLKKKKNNLVSVKTLGMGKLSSIATILGLVVTLFPYLSYIKKIANGVFMLAEFIIDVVVEIISVVGGAIVSLICKFIPYAGFILGWALGIVLDLVLDKVFNSKRISNIKNRYANMVKYATSWKVWINSLGNAIIYSF